MSLICFIHHPAWYIRNMDLCSVRVLKDVHKREWGRINILMGRILSNTSHCPCTMIFHKIYMHHSEHIVTQMFTNHINKWSMCIYCMCMHSCVHIHLSTYIIQIFFHMCLFIYMS